MSKVLVTYFSVSGVTADTAKMLAKTANADIFEIRPEQPYTESDVNWKNPFSRCNREKIGKKDIPTIGMVEDIQSYDLILVGFPIWYAGAPNVVQSFLKKHDLSGKRIALFATSGGSGMGRSAEKLRPFVSDTAKIISGRLFGKDDGEQSAKAWLEELKAI